MANTRAKNNDTAANLGFEAKLWLTADSRSAAEIAEGNRSTNMNATEIRTNLKGLGYGR